MAWDELAQLNQFQLGLSNEVKDILVCMESRRGLNAFFELGVWIDTQLSKLQNEKEDLFHVQALPQPLMQVNSA